MITSRAAMTVPGSGGSGGGEVFKDSATESMAWSTLAQVVVSLLPHLGHFLRFQSLYSSTRGGQRLRHFRQKYFSMVQLPFWVA